MASNACDIFAHRAAAAKAQDVYTDEEAERHAQEVGGLAPRPMETKNEIDERGAFVRQPNSFIVPFGEKEGEWKAEAGRYAIYWAHGCNWSNRPIIARDILGLQDVILDQTTSHSGETNKYGHGFGHEPGHKDPLTGVYFLSQFYKNANPDYKGRATTPTLVDIREKKAVNNDYHRLTNYIEVQFRKFQPVDAPDLYPKAYRREIDQLNDWLFPHVNNGHYRMAFCQTPFAYWSSYNDFYDSLDKLDQRLETNRFLFGDFITDSDIRLYVTLVRWDFGYYRSIGPTRKPIYDYKNLWGYLRELYWEPSFHKTQFVNELAAGNQSANADRDLFVDWNQRIASKINLDEFFAYDGWRKKLSNHPDEIYLRHPAGESPEDYQSEISFSPWNRPDQKDREADDPANSPLDVDASINPLKGKIDA